MKHLTSLLESVTNISTADVKLPETIFDSEVKFNGDGVFVDGHVISYLKEVNELALAGSDEDIWYINITDILESSESENKIEGLAGIPVRLKVKKDAAIRMERKLIVGKHILGKSSDSEAENLACNCQRNCSNGGYCCAQGGWIYVCQRNSCVFSNNRC
jgi:hypothetical protein